MYNTRSGVKRTKKKIRLENQKFKYEDTHGKHIAQQSHEEDTAYLSRRI